MKKRAITCSNSNSVVETGVKNLPSGNKTFPVRIKFIPVNSKVVVHVWSEPFNIKDEAENFIHAMNMFIDMSDSSLIESAITEKSQSVLNWEVVADLMRCLQITSYEEYLKWWDANKPSFIQRNLLDSFPNLSKFFNSTNAIAA